LSQISLPWQPGSVVVEFDWHHSIARPRIPPFMRNDLKICFTQAKLQPILSQISLPWQPWPVVVEF